MKTNIKHKLIHNIRNAKLKMTKKLFNNQKTYNHLPIQSNNNN